MLGVGSSTFYRMVIKDDGGPNWVGIVILSMTFVVVFIWRCVEFIPEYWVATRRRFNRVVRNKDGLPREYDPLAVRSMKPIKAWHLRQRLWRRVLRWAGEPEPTTRKVGSVRFRFYLAHSLVLVNCGQRETNLGIDSVTLLDIDFDTSMSAAWNVSRLPGNPTKSFLVPATTKWKWRSEKDELEQLVQSYVADAVLSAYEDLSRATEVTPQQLPLLDSDNPHIMKVAEFLLEEYGVELKGVLYGRRSVAPARRNLVGLLAIANANRDVAAAIRGNQVYPAASQEKQATAGGATVLGLVPPSA